ncbi:MAG: hypothetical protein ABI205_01310, partial [Gemmatimonadaceae bacterium]
SYHVSRCCASGPRTRDHPGTDAFEMCRRAEGAPSDLAKPVVPGFVARRALRPAHDIFSCASSFVTATVLANGQLAFPAAAYSM